MRKFAILAFLMITSATVGMAQKYGHLNFGTLLAAMPETKAADQQLADFQKQLVAKGEKMAAEFQKKVEDFYKNQQTMTPVQATELQKKLEGEQQSILAYEQEIVQKINGKREELLKPIIDKAQKAIDEVAKEQGFTMIFDSSMFNTILFAEESVDVMVFVAAKLGLE